MMSSSTNVAGNAANRTKLRAMVMIGMLGGVATVLMYFDIPLWFLPGFYEIDLSEVPIMIGAFAMGPLAGVLTELVKVLLNFVFTGSITAGVGEVANFLIGCALVLPASCVYRVWRSKKGALTGMAVGVAVMTLLGSLLNALVLLPIYAKAFGMPLDALVGMGTAINPAVDSVTTFALFMVVPFNLLKGVMVSVITFTLYKYINPIIKNYHM